MFLFFRNRTLYYLMISLKRKLFSSDHMTFLDNNVKCTFKVRKCLVVCWGIIEGMGVQVPAIEAPQLEIMSANLTVNLPNISVWVIHEENGIKWLQWIIWHEMCSIPRVQTNMWYYDTLHINQWQNIRVEDPWNRRWRARNQRLLYGEKWLNQRRNITGLLQLTCFRQPPSHIFVVYPLSDILGLFTLAWLGASLSRATNMNIMQLGSEILIQHWKSELNLVYTEGFAQAQPSQS